MLLPETHTGEEAKERPSAAMPRKATTLINSIAGEVGG